MSMTPTKHRLSISPARDACSMRLFPPAVAVGGNDSLLANGLGGDEEEQDEEEDAAGARFEELSVIYSAEGSLQHSAINSRRLTENGQAGPRRFSISPSRFSLPPGMSPPRSPGQDTSRELSMLEQTHTISIDDTKRTFVEFAEVGVSPKILSGEEMPVGWDKQRTEVLDEFVPGNAPVNGLNSFCFPNGARLELVEADKARDIAGRQHDRIHVLKFSDAVKNESHGCCYTMLEVLENPPAALLVNLLRRRWAYSVISAFVKSSRGPWLARRERKKDPPQTPEEIELGLLGRLRGFASPITTARKQRQEPARASAIKDFHKLHPLPDFHTPLAKAGQPMQTPAASAVHSPTTAMRSPTTAMRSLGPSSAARYNIHETPADRFRRQMGAVGTAKVIRVNICDSERLEEANGFSDNESESSASPSRDGLVSADGWAREAARRHSQVSKRWAVVAERCLVFVSCHEAHPLWCTILRTLADSERNRSYILDSYAAAVSLKQRLAHVHGQVGLSERARPFASGENFAPNLGRNKSPQHARAMSARDKISPPRGRHQSKSPSFAGEVSPLCKNSTESGLWQRRLARQQFLKYVSQEVVLPQFMEGGLEVSPRLLQHKAFSLKITLPAPPMNLWSCAVLFSMVNSKNIARCIHVLLLEKSLAVMGPDLGANSITCMALRSLLEPLDWEGPFVPIVPASFLPDGVQSPTATIFGLETPFDIDFYSSQDLTVLELDSKGKAAFRQRGLEVNFPYDLEVLAKSLQEANTLPVAPDGQHITHLQMRDYFITGMTPSERNCVITLRQIVRDYISSYCGDLESPGAWRAYGEYNLTQDEFIYKQDRFMYSYKTRVQFMDEMTSTQMFTCFVHRQRKHKQEPAK
jgi:hypothetical protein